MECLKSISRLKDDLTCFSMAIEKDSNISFDKIVRLYNEIVDHLTIITKEKELLLNTMASKLNKNKEFTFLVSEFVGDNLVHWSVVNGKLESVYNVEQDLKITKIK